MAIPRCLALIDNSPEELLDIMIIIEDVLAEYDVLVDVDFIKCIFRRECRLHQI